MLLFPNLVIETNHTINDYGDNFVYQEWVKEQPTKSLATIVEPEVEIKYDWTKCSCIEYVKIYYPDFQGQQLYYPKYLWEHYEYYGLIKTEGGRGDLIITTDNYYYWHIGIISSVSDETIKVIEKNLTPCKITTRVLEKNDERIVGYLK